MVPYVTLSIVTLALVYNAILAKDLNISLALAHIVIWSLFGMVLLLEKVNIVTIVIELYFAKHIHGYLRLLCGNIAPYFNCIMQSFLPIEVHYVHHAQLATPSSYQFLIGISCV